MFCFYKILPRKAKPQLEQLHRPARYESRQRNGFWWGMSYSPNHPRTSGGLRKTERDSVSSLGRYMEMSLSLPRGALTDRKTSSRCHYQTSPREFLNCAGRWFPDPGIHLHRRQEQHLTWIFCIIDIVRTVIATIISYSHLLQTLLIPYKQGGGKIRGSDCQEGFCWRWASSPTEPGRGSGSSPPCRRGAAPVPYPGRSASRSSPSSRPGTDPSASGPASPTPAR